MFSTLEFVNRRVSMRLTLKKYEAAKKALKDAEAHKSTMRAWEDAIRKIGNPGDQKVVVIKIDDDGEMTTECEPNGKPQAKPEGK